MTSHRVTFPSSTRTRLGAQTSVRGHSVQCLPAYKGWAVNRKGLKVIKIASAALRLSRARGEFRWGIIWVVAVLLLLAWLASGARAGLSWDRVMDYLHVKNKERYTQLAVLGCTLCTILAIARILGWKKDE